MLAVHERPSMLITYALTNHGAAMVGLGTLSSAATFSVIDAATTNTIGVGAVVGLVLTMVTLVFRTQQQQIRSQGRRIAELEHELDILRHPRRRPAT